MLFRQLFNILLSIGHAERPLLGRWGYHWEKNKYVQKYYE
jgi:hypothetical protein